MFRLLVNYTTGTSQFTSTALSTKPAVSKTIGFIRHNLKACNKKIKEAAYKALVRPVLEYASTVWDPYTIQEVASLEKIQRRAARWVLNRHRQTLCVDSMLHELDWPSLQSRQKKARLGTLYRHHTGTISINPEYRSPLTIWPTPERHQEDQRHCV